MWFLLKNSMWFELSTVITKLMKCCVCRLGWMMVIHVHFYVGIHFAIMAQHVGHFNGDI